MSAITVQKILNDKGLGTRHERWLALERQNAEAAIELSPEQAAFLEKLNPCFRERHVESERPGQLLSADTFMVGSLKGIGRVYLHAVVDTHGSYAFGFLHVSKQPEAAVAVLHNDVLPFYRKLDLPVTAVLTDNGREFCGTERHPYELYLALNDIEHRKTKVRSPQTNGFVERFNGTVLEEFFRPVMHQSCSRVSRRCRPSSTPGCTTTTTSDRISATATRAGDHGRRSNDLSDKEAKRTHDVVHKHALPDQVCLLLTYGSGLNKLSELRCTIASDEIHGDLSELLSSWKVAPLSALFGFALVFLSTWPVLAHARNSISLYLFGWWSAAIILSFLVTAVTVSILDKLVIADKLKVWVRGILQALLWALLFYIPYFGFFSLFLMGGDTLCSWAWGYLCPPSKRTMSRSRT